ncbi:hypothetical protein [Priestia megaterium]|uniref:hypothetical protein n=1 Tax=Priestia megaterium TaxID=1404 RepID=UPI001ABFC641|nr:hypothetical protein [Priestia megaterium]
MDSYIKQWHELILNCNFDNTYKMVWSKTLVELSLSIDKNSDEKIIVFDFNKIAKLCLKYYWNQTIYFDMVQRPNLRKPPEIITFTKKLTKEFFSKKVSFQPVRFEKVDFTSLAMENQYETAVKNIAKTLRKDVYLRFKKLNGTIYEIYDLDTKRDRLFFSPA